MKKTALALTLISAFLITGTVLTAFEIMSPAGANPVPSPEKLATEQAYIRSNGTVDPSILPVQREGNIYRLTDNILNYTLEVQRDNVVIDGNGFSLSIPAFGEIGDDGQTKGANPLISISNKTDIIVRNVIFDKYSTAVDIRNSSNIIFFQNTMRNGSTGIYLLQSANCSLVNNKIAANSVFGVLIQDSTSLNISYNEISGNQCGTEVDHLTQSVFNGLQNSNITRNDFTNNIDVGLQLSGPHSNNQIVENNFVNNDVGLCYSFRGLTLNNTVYDNYWSNQDLQIQVNGVEAIGSIDKSPLSSSISTVFDPSIFPLPLITPTPKSEPEPFPTTLIIGSAVAVVVVVWLGLLVYFKKRHRDETL
jgi:parallel beta-helix repeat protein